MRFGEVGLEGDGAAECGFGLFGAIKRVQGVAEGEMVEGVLRLGEARDGSDRGHRRRGRRGGAPGPW
jgi:hypothetical protein